MRLTTIGWSRYAVLYRALVVVQTLGWAVSTLARVIARQPRSSLHTPPIGIALGIGSIVGLAAGMATYYLRRTESRDKAAAMVAWAWFQAAGLLALVGYSVTGTAFCFGIGVITLAVMHVFSPNRFQDNRRA